MNRSSHGMCSVRKNVLRNFAKHTGARVSGTCVRVSFLINFSINLIKKEMAQVFSCEFYEISNNTLSYRKPPVAAFGMFFTLIAAVLCSRAGLTLKHSFLSQKMFFEHSIQFKNDLIQFLKSLLRWKPLYSNLSFCYW